MQLLIPFEKIESQIDQNNFFNTGTFYSLKKINFDKAQVLLASQKMVACQFKSNLKSNYKRKNII